MSRKPIKDRFSKLPISRQRKYQLRHQANGLCIKCTDEALPGFDRCEKHVVASRENYRRKVKTIRRNNSKFTRYMESVMDNDSMA